MEKEIEVAKIVGTPTPSSWSQAYNAGKLFAALSLKKEVVEKEGELNLLGKNTLETLESEFFPLEKKDLESIKSAVEKTAQRIPEDVTSSFVVCAIVENVLYAFVKGSGLVSLKREGKIGTILKGDRGLRNASGFLQDGDIIILQTSDFANLISHDKLSLSLQSFGVSEIAETLAPLIHEREAGGAASIIIEYKKGVPEEVAAVEPLEEETQEPQAHPERKQALDFENFKSKGNQLFAQIKNLTQSAGWKPNITHSRRVYITVGAIILLVLVSSLVFALKRQSDQKTAVLFDKYYTPALQKYEEGQSLVDLNRSLARDSFISSQKLLNEGRPKFNPSSKEGKQVNDLLNKVNEALSSTSQVIKVSPKAVDLKESPILSLELKTKDAPYFSQDEENLYFVTKDGVSKANKKGGSPASPAGGSKVILENKNDWKEVGGLGVYFSNIYILDKTSNQILKYIQTATELVKTNYFAKDTKYDVSQAQSLAIDGSIYVLSKDGKIQKFTKGVSETFQIKGLEKAFSNPTRIATSADFKKIYILDNGNSRIIVLDKNGAYQSQYVADILKSAKDFEVLEGSKKIFVLVDSKIFQIDLK